jgi:hypothetical protein
MLSRRKHKWNCQIQHPPARKLSAAFRYANVYRLLLWVSRITFAQALSLFFAKVCSSKGLKAVLTCEFCIKWRMSVLCDAVPPAMKVLYHTVVKVRTVSCCSTQRDSRAFGVQIGAWNKEMKRLFICLLKASVVFKTGQPVCDGSFSDWFNKVRCSCKSVVLEFCLSELPAAES